MKQKRQAQMFHFGFLVLISALISLGACSPVAFAEFKHQTADLFWIDVPEGWQWNEDSGSVTVMSPSGHQALHIDFEVVDGIHSDEDTTQMVRQAMDARVREVASRNGKTVMSVERTIDGVPALQRGFLIAAPGGMRQATAIEFYKDRHLYDIYLEAPREFQRLEMEKIVDTMQFQAPEPKQNEAEVSEEDGSASGQ